MHRSRRQIFPDVTRDHDPADDSQIVGRGALETKPTSRLFRRGSREHSPHYPWPERMDRTKKLEGRITTDQSLEPYLYAHTTPRQTKADQRETSQTLAVVITIATVHLPLIDRRYQLSKRSISNIKNSETASHLAFSLGSFALSYATAIVSARALGAKGYDDYAVAVSSAVILATLAEMGTGKYALRIIPASVELSDWAAANGYIRLSTGLMLVTSSILAIVRTGWEDFKDGQFGNYAVGFVLLFLPVIAWVGVGSELLTANRAAIQSACITRLLVPGAILVLDLIWVASPMDLTASQGVLCYGLG